MNISLQDVIPVPLADNDLSDSEIWASPLQIDASSFNLVRSASGKGKTSLASFLYGMRKDFSGEILFDDRSVSTFTLDDWAKLRKETISFMFQKLAIFPELSALDNILIKNSLTDFKSEAEIMQMAEELGVKHILHKPAGIISFGQRQRIGIIRAMCQPFTFIVLDEPFSHLDEGNIAIASTLITGECKKQGAGLILMSLGYEYQFTYDYKFAL